MLSAVGFGAAISAVGVGRLRRLGSIKRSARFSLPISGLGLLIILLFPDRLAASLLGAVILGGGVLMNGVCIQTALQISAGEDVRGRVLAVYGLVVRGGTAIGALVFGYFSELASIQGVIAISIVVSVCLWAFILYRS